MSSAGNPNDPTESLKVTIYGASIGSVVIATLFFSLRQTAERLQKQSFNGSDAALLAAVCCVIGMAICSIYSQTLGLGLHMDVVVAADPTYQDTAHLLKVYIVACVFYDWAIGTVKLSILLMYRSLFPERRFVILCNLLIFVVIGWSIANCIPTIFSCRPISGFWDLTLNPPPVCIDKMALYVAGSSLNILTDVLILALPVSKVVKLHMNTQTKLALVGLFLSGGVVIIISAIRFNVLILSNSPDITWQSAQVLDWCMAESATAIAAASLPTFRPLWRFITGQKQGDSSKALSYYNGNSAKRASVMPSSNIRSKYTSRADLDLDGFERLSDPLSTVVEHDNSRSKSNIADSTEGIVVETTIETTYEMHPMGKKEDDLESQPGLAR